MFATSWMFSLEDMAILTPSIGLRSRLKLSPFSGIGISPLAAGPVYLLDHIVIANTVDVWSTMFDGSDG
ncbi:MAG TPA: hypothetical protein PLK88_02075 [Methanothrix sp.]|nr:hypothetical protein [Methanothrix sp.]